MGSQCCNVNSALKKDVLGPDFESKIRKAVETRQKRKAVLSTIEKTNFHPEQKL